MEIRQLQHFLAVAEELHFGRAAQRLHISQPPLSQSIRKLEDDLGVRLFARSSRSVALTPAGEFLVGEARAIVGRVGEARRAVERVGRGEQGELRVGVVGPALEGPLPGVIRAFGQENPLLRVALRQATSAEQIDALEAGSLDVGVLRPHRQSLRGLRHALWRSERYALALPDDHPLARAGVAELGDLDGETLILFPREAHPTLHDAILAALHAAGACPELLFAALLKHPTEALVAAGMGMALMPESMADAARPGVAFVPIHGELPPVEYVLAWNPANETPQAARFVEAMLDAR